MVISEDNAEAIEHVKALLLEYTEIQIRNKTASEPVNLTLQN